MSMPIPYSSRCTTSHKQGNTPDFQRRVIAFPTTPPFARGRKRGCRPHTELKAHVASNLPELLAAAWCDIARLWSKGVQIGWIAKMHDLTIPQVEAVLWVWYHEPAAVPNWRPVERAA